MRYPVSDPGSQLHNGKFTDGNPALGIPASVDKAAHMNAVYDELLAVISAAGLTPNETTFNQVLQAVQGLINGSIATRAPLSHGHNWGEISGKPATYPATQHQHDWGQITGKPAVYPAASHDHPYVPTAGNADTVDGYHAHQLWRTDQMQTHWAHNSIAHVLPSGWILQAGQLWIGDAYPNTQAQVNYPLTFPNACLLTQSMYGHNFAGAPLVYQTLKTNSYCTFALGEVHSTVQQFGFTWMAIGF